MYSERHKNKTLLLGGSSVIDKVMIRFIKKLPVYLLLSSCMPSIYCQPQADFNEYITGKFTKYIKAIPREEIFVHTDRSEYISGEELWFNVYLFGRDNNKLSSGSKIAYAELLNSENSPVAQTRILLDNGFGPGQVELPDTLSSGRYTLRAYTSWMKNFLPENCFMKEILIYNAIANKPTGLKSNKGSCFAKNRILSGTTDTAWHPVRLIINNAEPDSLRIILTTDENFRSRNKNSCYLFIRTNCTINHISEVKLQPQATGINLSKKILTPGINHITLFDFERKPVMERFIYTPLSTASHPAILSPDIFRIRDSISIGIQLDKESDPITGRSDLSISVIPATVEGRTPDIADYMVFGSEFGVIPDAILGPGLGKVPPEILDTFLLTLKSNWIDWSLILAEKLPPLKYFNEDEDHILSGRFTASDSCQPAPGQVIFLSSPGKNAEFQYAETDNEGYFNFHIPIDGDTHDLIIQSSDASKKGTIIIDSSFPELYPCAPLASGSPAIAIPGHIAQLSVSYQIGMIYGLPAATAPPASGHKGPAPKRFYGKPDIELVMDNYILLSSMEEVFFELTPGLQFKKRNSLYRMSIANPIDNTPYKNPPVLFIDGVVIDDPGVIGEMDPAIVEKIDAFRNMYMVGDLVFYGLVNIITRAGDFSSVKLPDHAVRLNYTIARQAKSFRSPDYSIPGMKQSRIPDFRNTLYWNPDVRPDSAGKTAVNFWTSDAAGEFEIIVQGLTSSGLPVSMKKTISVR